MSAEHEEDFDALMARARRLKRPEARVEVLEAAVRVADAQHDLDRGYAARDAYIEAATFASQPDKALVAFAWCRAQAARHPGRFQESFLLWRHKWVTHNLSKLPQVPRARVEAALEDFALAAEKQGASPRATLKLRYQVALSLGEPERARELLPRWVDAPRDWYSDCAACDRNEEALALAERGEHARALERAEPIVRGRMTCGVIPHQTLGWVANARFHLGDLEGARDAFLRGYRLVKDSSGHLEALADHVRLLALTENVGPVLTLLERHLKWGQEARTPLYALRFWAAAGLALERAGAQGQHELALRLPRTFPLYRRSGAYATGALREWVDAQASALAGRFDARNGNDHFTRWLERERARGIEVRPFPITTGVG